MKDRMGAQEIEFARISTFGKSSLGAICVKVDFSSEPEDLLYKMKSQIISSLLLLEHKEKLSSSSAIYQTLEVHGLRVQGRISQSLRTLMLGKNDTLCPGPLDML